MTDYKEYAKQMRENAVKNEQGNIVCSPELWEEIASVIERAIVPPCNIDDILYYPWIYGGTSGIALLEVSCIKIYVQGRCLVFYNDVESDMPMPACFTIEDFGKTVFLAKEEAEEKLKELGNNG